MKLARVFEFLIMLFAIIPVVIATALGYTVEIDVTEDSFKRKEKS